MHDTTHTSHNAEDAAPAIGAGRSAMLLRLAPAMAIIAGFAAFWLLGLDRYVSFEALAAYRDELRGLVARNEAGAALAFVLAYTVMVVLNIPAATVATMAGGFLFGVLPGALLSTTAATIGATGVFLAARLAVGDSLLRRARPAVRRMEAGFKRNALSYMLVLRLIPLFPFWIINIVPAMLGVPLRVFVLGTLLGAFPGSIVFSGLGDGLAGVLARGEPPGPEILLAPRVLWPLVALAVLALLPVAWRWRQRRRGND